MRAGAIRGVPAGSLVGVGRWSKCMDCGQWGTFRLCCCWGCWNKGKDNRRHHKYYFVDPSVLMRAFSRGGKRSSRSSISLNYSALLFTFVFLTPWHFSFFSWFDCQGRDQYCPFCAQFLWFLWVRRTSCESPCNRRAGFRSKPPTHLDFLKNHYAINCSTNSLWSLDSLHGRGAKWWCTWRPHMSLQTAHACSEIALH